MTNGRNDEMKKRRQKMLSGIGVFAGGLADGMRVGQDMKIRQQYIDGQKKANARDAELHQAGIDEINLNREKRGRLKDANDEIAAGGSVAPFRNQRHPIPPD